uniref:Uncharacterized protein n=1 Tax=Arundo donax TaxID=35708 RepID=A0A0A8Z8Y2_ARUDO
MSLKIFLGSNSVLSVKYSFTEAISMISRLN